VLGALKFKAPQRNVTIALLLLILAAAFVLRGMQAGFGMPYLHYWDEPQTASTALNIIKSGDPNPHFFRYGSLLIYACVLADFVYYFFAHDLSLSSSLHLDSISDVVTNADTNWPWTISHPQFYVADRFLIVLFGVGTVAVTYLIGARLLPVGFALGAAAFLATSPFHVGHSYVVTTDVPVAFFVITATWALLVFLEEKATWALVVAAISVGLACATKYNSGLIYLPLVLSVGMEGLKVWRSDPKRAIKWAIIACVVPGLAFFVAMPYALLDYKSFFHDMLSELNHYSRWGHPGATVEAGLPHLKVIIADLVSQNGVVASVLAVIGFATIRSMKTAIVFCYPIVFILFMSAMKVEFDRNYVQVYPYIALLAMSGTHLGWQVVTKLIAASRKYHVAGILAAALVAYVVYGNLDRTVPNVVYGNLEKTVPAAINTWNRKETRSLAIEQVTKLGNSFDVVIPEELRVHEQDLARLDRQYLVVPLSAVLRMVCSAQASQHNFVLPTYTLLSPWAPPDEPTKTKQLVAAAQKVVAEVVKAPGVEQIPGGPLNVDIYSIDPGVIVVPAGPQSCEVDAAKHESQPNG
jgi:hypothetical protein